MAKKCLIVYQSNTGNTEKVAIRFKSTFEKNGWECDMAKISRKTDLGTIPLIRNYDFLCVGSPVYGGLPPEEMRTFMDPDHSLVRTPSELQGISLSAYMEMMKGPGKMKGEGKLKFKLQPFERMRSGPKKGIVFATYFGAHFGPIEAEPALKWLALSMKHIKFECIGSFCCPGKGPGMKEATTKAYHGDCSNRPNEKDLLKAELFIEEVLEAIK